MQLETSGWPEAALNLPSTCRLPAVAGTQENQGSVAYTENQVFQLLLESPTDISARRQDWKGWEPASCLTPVVIQINIH